MAAKESAFWQEHKDSLKAFGDAARERGEVPDWVKWVASVGGAVSSGAARMKYLGLVRDGMGLDPDELPQSIIRPMPQRPRLSQIIDLNPQPFAVPVPQAAKATNGKARIGVVYGDTHSRFRDQAALDVVAGIIRDVKPDYLIHLGDLLDCWSISRFDKDPSRWQTLQDEIDWARTHLHQMAQLAPQAKRYLLEGNHEDRLRKLIWTLPGTASELARLRSFQKAMTWPELMQLDGIGWEFVPATGQARHQIIPQIITKHGTVVRKWSGMSAKGEWERYGKSGISGHVHRLGRFYSSDRNGAHTWVEAGCTCSIEPEYVEDPNWQQGCVVIEHSADGQRFEMYPIYIERGRARFGQKDYRAAA